MAKSSVLDEAIAATAPAPVTKKVDRILAGLNGVDAMHKPGSNPDDPRPDWDRILDIVSASRTVWPHTRTAGILRAVCDDHKVPHDNVIDKDVAEWRATQAER